MCVCVCVIESIQTVIPVVAAAAAVAAAVELRMERRAKRLRGEADVIAHIAKDVNIETQVGGGDGAVVVEGHVGAAAAADVVIGVPSVHDYEWPLQRENEEEEEEEEEEYMRE